MACAVLGFVLTWIIGTDSFAARIARRNELLFIRHFSRFGWLFVTCALTFSMSAMWSGVVRDGDSYNQSIGGLIPFFLID